MKLLKFEDVYTDHAVWIKVESIIAVSATSATFENNPSQANVIFGAGNSFTVKNSVEEVVNLLEDHF